MNSNPIEETLAALTAERDRLQREKDDFIRIVTALVNLYGGSVTLSREGLLRSERRSLHLTEHADCGEITLSVSGRLPTAEELSAPPEPYDLSQPGHGWVRPHPQGLYARCGGPAICRWCQAERRAVEESQRKDSP